MEIYIYAIAALLPITAGLVILQKNPYNALIMRGILGAVAALVYALWGAADVALTEALMGTLLAITLYAIAVRSSMVVKLGVRADTADQVIVLELVARVRAVFSQHYLRTELVVCGNLEQALGDRLVHGIVVLETDQPLAKLRIPRLYEILMGATPELTDNLELQQ